MIKIKRFFDFQYSVCNWYKINAKSVVFESTLQMNEINTLFRKKLKISKLWFFASQTSIFWEKNVKVKKRNAHLIRQKLFYYQFNRFVKISDDQFFGTYISDRWCHITLLWKFLKFLLSIFLQLERTILLKIFFANVTDN